jgi:hypothetical protein
MPKGGVKAAQAHNQRVMPPVVAPVEPSTPSAVTTEGRTDGRASGRSAGLWTERAVVVGSSVAASAGVSALLDWLFH